MRALIERVQSWRTDAPMQLGSTGLWAFHAPRTLNVSLSAWYVAADQQAATAARAARLALRDAFNSPEAVAQRAREAAEHLSALRKLPQRTKQGRSEVRTAAERQREAAGQQASQAAGHPPKR